MIWTPYVDEKKAIDEEQKRVGQREHEERTIKT